MKMSGTGLSDASSFLHLEVSSEVSKQTHPLTSNFFRFKGLSEGVYRLRPPPPMSGPTRS
ncbi:hypothetical protein XAC3810_250022 [Xanthomonas citri pv. citri]|uniref:Uncharacterized protein n=1 Tax=Xanthomonas citri pv. citri TaxID=611301 RepID=A0A0U5FFQ5_XANCI|nr:hypothetical protein XAC9322_240022 [Xanthomonas citri pv. citri]CEE23048.1 hypothetical protein XAC1083_230021 [Xanthomonas citri pv. citri]CEE31402.1 hypothetical protein XAC3810_250022 [Xanthomonas citri pv. citri]CEE37791.1 hypothetical protein XAC908_360022 [Xanthomonas citri pv. citri]CEE60292.1 hypothetical protein XACW160_300022 [Xanthomonas citri pv. citri]